ncbi:TPA: DUF4888 domain-containing protein [Staphylococcus aureus]|uniref:DUF4888 domain-containing protein n=1 Tax=Staphylococcus aureus TaxID=1280 RepID=UPI00085CAFAA|nr:DUF4888 domain-containing protein [Staphylococcus aureus]SCU53831.1 beta-lactamase [Staphylococcus aureus]HCY8319419.1 DUF4888 domain-containing protein [Staphylococcus aureus]
MNTKFLGKTLVASALVLTTLGTGIHSSYLGLDTNKVVKTAKAEENMTDGQLWKKVKDSLIDSDIISGNRDEEIKVTYSLKDGNSPSVTAPGNDSGDNFNQKIDFGSLKQVDISKQNIGEEDFNKRLDANKTWNTFTQKLKDAGLLKNGQKVTIQATNPTTSSTNSITGTVGDTLNDKNADPLEKRFINKITIE